MAGISHRGSQWLFPGIYHQHTNEERQNCPGKETSSSRRPCGRAAASAGLSFPQLSTATKTAKKMPCTRGAESCHGGRWDHLKATGNTTYTKTKEAKPEQSREPHSGPCSLFFRCSQLSVPMTAVSHLHSTGGHYNRPTLSPAVRIFLSLFWLREIYSTWHLPKSTNDLV